MLRLTKKEDYSILILTYFSTRQGLGTSARQVADHYRMSPSFTSSILKELAKSGILKSERGASGGYSLNVLPSELTVFQVLEAVSGKYALTACVFTEDGEEINCEVSSTCSIQKPVKILNDKIQSTLKSLTIADLQEMATS